jgi:mono/diheme cytochrome c family protein
MQKLIRKINVIAMVFRKALFIVPISALLFSGNLLASDIGNGRQIYQRHCAMCHGQNGDSVMAGAANFNRGEGLFQSEYSLLARIKSGKNACPAYRGILSEQKIFDVIAYIRTLN